MQACRLVAVKAPGSNFSNARLKACDCAKADFTGAKFFQADLVGSEFDRAMLHDIDFRQAQLSGVNFCQSDLSFSRFREAKLAGTDFRGADLTGAHELTAAQLVKARTDERTILPNGTRGPYSRFSGAEKCPFVSR